MREDRKREALRRLQVECENINASVNEKRRMRRFRLYVQRATIRTTSSSNANVEREQARNANVRFAISNINSASRSLFIV